MIGQHTSPLFSSILPVRIGYIIQQKRKQLGLTQNELAGKTRFSKYMISKIESGMHDTKITEIQRLAFGLETSVKNIIAEASSLENNGSTNFLADTSFKGLISCSKSSLKRVFKSSGDSCVMAICCMICFFCNKGQ